MDLRKALIPIEELEQKLASLYEWFSVLSESDDEAKSFFARLSREELSHQQIVQYERRIIMRNPKIFDAIDVDVEVVHKVIGDIDHLMKEKPPSDLNAMIRITLDIESSAAENYYRTAMIESNADVAQFLHRLGLSFKTHLKAVEEFAELKGVIPPTPPKRTPAVIS
jgi:rubrerythrin